ncbi:ATP12 family chaperone protein [Kordiimonas marina]|uniref:ATP12 family chaperone protein n=1 Tax=Kordiimonas marina TaxID=2872312 RepID=UPI001FF3CC89|nr:ATP12 family protein [Kordiimonas marina]MCJ9429263.1 hypothetical protein [Kordiimonas marina]
MKRFYKTVSVESTEAGHVVALDGRIVKTPARETLAMPTKALAEAVAAEWDAQADEVKPDTMPVTKLANTVQDRVAPRHDEVVAEVANYAGTDLLCYRADDPAELAALQAKAWDPYLDWLAEEEGIRLKVTDGIMPIAQDKAALDAITAIVKAHDPYELTALHAFTTGLGSLILGLALMRGFTDFDTIWRASLVDAEHQEEKWGTDWEAEEKRDLLRADMEAAIAFLSHMRNKSLESPAKAG